MRATASRFDRGCCVITSAGVVSAYELDTTRQQDGQQDRQYPASITSSPRAPIDTPRYMMSIPPRGLGVRPETRRRTGPCLDRISAICAHDIETILRCR